MKPKMTALQILTEARRLINERGHAYHVYEDANGCLCATGAIIKAFDPSAGMWSSLNMSGTSFLSYTNKDEIKEVGKIFMEANPMPLYEENPDDLWYYVFKLNDASSKYDILAAFDKAMKLAKDKENG